MFFILIFCLHFIHLIKNTFYLSALVQTTEKNIRGNFITNLLGLHSSYHKGFLTEPAFSNNNAIVLYQLGI